MNIATAISEAEAVLPGKLVHEGEDPRWQAIIRIGEFIEAEPEAVWGFVCRWGRHPDEDLRDAVATCLLEHLLEHHFAAYFPRIEALALAEPLFGYTFRMCWQFGQSLDPGQAERFAALQLRLK